MMVAIVALTAVVFATVVLILVGVTVNQIKWQ